MRTVLDTNIIISAILFDGAPRIIFLLAISGEITAITSSPLLAELNNVLHKKFQFAPKTSKQVDHKLRHKFKLVTPHQTINILKDTLIIECSKPPTQETATI